MESPSVMTLVAKPLIISLAIPLLGGMGSGFITKNAVNTWYRTLKKPSYVASFSDSLEC